MLCFAEGKGRVLVVGGSASDSAEYRTSCCSIVDTSTRLPYRAYLSDPSTTFGKTILGNYEQFVLQTASQQQPMPS